ncbi:MAG: hypothetical protein LBQ26_01425 [Holosporales bacterium]|jgi:hypothetical protein|nr:hypothetical protein [Holosporales bacterium]
MKNHFIMGALVVAFVGNFCISSYVGAMEGATSSSEPISARRPSCCSNSEFLALLQEAKDKICSTGEALDDDIINAIGMISIAQRRVVESSEYLDEQASMEMDSILADDALQSGLFHHLVRMCDDDHCDYFKRHLAASYLTHKPLPGFWYSDNAVQLKYRLFLVRDELTHNKHTVFDSTRGTYRDYDNETFIGLFSIADPEQQIQEGCHAVWQLLCSDQGHCSNEEIVGLAMWLVKISEVAEFLSEEQAALIDPFFSTQNMNKVAEALQPLVACSDSIHLQSTARICWEYFSERLNAEQKRTEQKPSSFFLHR